MTEETKKLPDKEMVDQVIENVIATSGDSPGLEEMLTEIFKDPKESTERNYDRNIKTFGIITAIL